MPDGRRHQPAGRGPADQPGRGRGPPGRGHGHVLRQPGAVGGVDRRRTARGWSPASTTVPRTIDDEVARLKLAAMGVRDRPAHRGAGRLPRPRGSTGRRTARSPASGGPASGRPAGRCSRSGWSREPRGTCPPSTGSACPSPGPGRGWPTWAPGTWSRGALDGPLTGRPATSRSIAPVRGAGTGRHGPCPPDRPRRRWTGSGRARRRTCSGRAWTSRSSRRSALARASRPGRPAASAGHEPPAIRAVEWRRRRAPHPGPASLPAQEVFLEARRPSEVAVAIPSLAVAGRSAPGHHRRRTGWRWPRIDRRPERAGPAAGTSTGPAGGWSASRPTAVNAGLGACSGCGRWPRRVAAGRSGGGATSRAARGSPHRRGRTRRRVGPSAGGAPSLLPHERQRPDPLQHRRAGHWRLGHRPGRSSSRRIEAGKALHVWVDETRPAAARGAADGVGAAAAGDPA